MPRLSPLPGFIGPSYVAQSPRVDVERCVNWFLERKTDGTNPESDSWFLPTPGLTFSLNCGDGAHRAAFALNGRKWVITGVTYSEIIAGVAVAIGTVADDGLPASIASNGPGGNQNLIVAGGKGYIHNLTTGAFAVIADPDFPVNAGMCAFLDGYFIVNQRNTAKFMISALEDGISWDPLDVAQKSQTPDFILAIVVDFDRKTLWLYGPQYTEIWWDSGAAAFPFEPVPNAIMSVGIAGAAAWAQPDNAIQWIGENANGSRQAFEATGTTPTRISTAAVEFAWSQYGTATDCNCLEYQYRGHVFTVFQFPLADKTWVYDRTEKAWHEWLEWYPNQAVFHAHRASTHLFVDGTHYIGSRLDGKLYTLSGDVYSEAGTYTRRMRRSPHINAEDVLIFCPELRFGFQPGVGLASGQGVDPQVMLRISKDGGRTWGIERWTTLGALGAYLTRIRYLRNGSWRDGVIEITVSDPVMTTLTECNASLRKGGA